jgi:hypothetical protein
MKHSMRVSSMLFAVVAVLAFAAYGSASPWWDHYPKLAYDPLHNRFLVVFTRWVADDNYDVYGVLMNPDGTAFGSWFVICNASNIQSSPSVAYDTVNQRYLVVWHETDSSHYSNIWGQLVNADGTLYKTVSEFNFWISTAANHQVYPSVAYGTASERFLVAWCDYRNGWRDIYGQLVNADGTLYNTASNTNFVISNATNDQANPSVAYDTVNHRFLVAWQDYRNGNYPDIYGQLVNTDGTLYNTASNTNFVISNAANDQLYPSVAYDASNQRFLVAWWDHRGSTFDIYGQLVNAAGTLYNTASNTNFVISNAAYDQMCPSVAYDTANQRFLVGWQDYRMNSISTDIYGQLVNANGTLYNTASNTNFLISNATNDQLYPSVAYNSTCGNFLTAYETYERGVWDIGVAVVGPPCTITYTLAINKIGTGSGTVKSSPSGIDCGPTCSAYYPPGSTVILTATPAADGSIFSGWSDNPDCTDGSVFMAMTKSCTATFDLCPGTTRASIGSTNYDSISLAYGGAATNGDIIKVIASNQMEGSLDFHSGKSVALIGGYDCVFSNIVSYTVVTGSITITNGTMILENIVVK